MTLDQWSSLSSIVSAVALVTSVVYASIQIRRNTLAVLATAYQQVVNSFAQISFDVAKDAELSTLMLHGGRDYAALDDTRRTRFNLMLLSFLRRAESVHFQSDIGMLEDAHWSGIRDSVASILATPGARAAWSEIRTRFNPHFREFIDMLIGSTPDPAIVDRMMPVSRP